MHHRAKDYTGQVFGCLTALKYAGTNGRRSMWTFRCTCEKEVVRGASDTEKYARQGGNPSCGCMIGVKSKSHGMSKHPVYAVWRSMKDRCRLPTHQAWHNYGARGITVCSRWDGSFEEFWADMGPTYMPGLTLDRKDNNGNYIPENCRWVTPEIQAQNTRSALPVDLKKAVALTGVSRSTLLYRWHRNLSMTSATPDPDRVSWSEVFRTPS